MSLTKYSEYKNSGVDWLGSVPAQWGVVRLKCKVSLVTEKATQRIHPVALENIEGWSGKFISTEGEFEGDGVAFAAGDLLFGKLRPYLAKAYLASGAGEAVGDFHVLRSSKALNPRFLQYQILNKAFIDVIDGSTFGSKMPRASWESLGNMLVTLPSFDEQTAISSFLDRETAKIDALITEQEKLIALLAEKRQATISHAVTKGLNHSAPLKNSGVAWLGDIPAHWTACPLKLLARIGNGSTPNRDNLDYWADEGFPWLNSSVVNQDEVSEAERFVTELALKECHLPVVVPPAVLVGITGQGKTRGMATRLAFTATINQHVAYVKPTEGSLAEPYLLRVFEAVYLHLRTESEGAGSTKGAITCEQLGNLRVPVPELAEQFTIVSFLEREVTKLEKLATDSERGIALLKERRSALIAAAVTGQIDVRGTISQVAAERPEAIAA